MHIKTMSVLSILALLAFAAGCGKSGSAPQAGGGEPVVNEQKAAAMPVVKDKSGIEMVQLPGGKFKMGSNTPGQGPIHEVTIKPFLIDKTEVTQANFVKLMGKEKSRFKGDNNPVEQVPWAEAVMYCNARSKAEGLTPCYNEDTGECNFEANGYRLPTEAEWEFAARAGSDAEWSFGSNERQLGDYAWIKDNSDNKTHPVAQKKPNAWGICDMYGNVAEWTNDVFDENYYKTSPAADPRGGTLSDEAKFVIRGGAYRFEPATCTSAWRQGEFPGTTDGCINGDYLGFRCARNK
ncbi:formylglycine-generating enzyme family protein [bacterium]|nr:formylglycine-generating enzyme family protein [bacterium]